MYILSYAISCDIIWDKINNQIVYPCPVYVWPKFRRTNAHPTGLRQVTFDFLTAMCNQVQWSRARRDDSRPPGREVSCLNGTRMSNTAFTNDRRRTAPSQLNQCTFQHPICSLFSVSVTNLLSAWIMTLKVLRKQWRHEEVEVSGICSYLRHLDGGECSASRLGRVACWMGG
jgi:hypothetical protein